MEETVSLESFKRQLQDALVHLHDPDYRPPGELSAALGCAMDQEAAVQAALINAIYDLEPDSAVPVGSRARQMFDILHQRFVLALTQEKTAERSHLSVRSVQRIQQRAVYMLARRLWEAGKTNLSPPSIDAALDQPAATAPASRGSEAEWHAQLKQELIWLQQSAPDATTNIGATIDGVLKLGGILAAKQGVSLRTGSALPEISISVHPTALRQILLTAVEKLVQQMNGGEITFRVETEATYVNIVIDGHPFMRRDDLPESDLIQEIILTQQGKMEIDFADDRLVFQIRFPYISKEVVVLVVDDNEDLVNFYRNYTTGTRYEIVHLTSGERLFETIAARPPDVIVLDVMLPDTDGWELLTYLRQHPQTRSIPVIICSVVKREELALALGAVLYLPKPVRLKEFIQALDRALVVRPVASSGNSGHSSTSD